MTLQDIATQSNATARAPSISGRANAGKQLLPPSAIARIVLVDDHPMVLDGLSQVIAGEPGLQVVGQANGAGAGMQIIHALRPALVILDLNLQDGDGLEMIKDIKARFRSVKVLVSSMQDELLYARRALRAGACGYINKSASPGQIVAAIRQVLEGKIYVSEGVAMELLCQAANQAEPEAPSPVSLLTDRELCVFEMLGRGLGTREIGQRLHLAVKTIQTYRQNLKRKLGMTTSTALVQEAVRWQMQRK